MTATTITPWYQRPTPIPTDFIGTPDYVEKLRVFEKQEGLAVPFHASGYGTTPSTTYCTTAYFIFVMTQYGDMRVEVSKEVFDLLRLDETIVVSYRRGRWTRVLKGNIAR